MRSLGKYQHILSSTGNFRFTSSYHTKNKRYHLRAHLVNQDLLNQENGGIAGLLIMRSHLIHKEKSWPAIKRTINQSKTMYS
jgi:hypothetical protein